MRKSAATLFGLCRLALGLTRSGCLRALLARYVWVALGDARNW